MKPLLFLLLAALLAAAVPAGAQINVDLSLKRRIYILNEPIMATVTVTNLTGHDIVLEDTPHLQWFGFQITGKDERVIPPRSADYSVPPLAIKAGAQARRTVNLTELYEMAEFGVYHIRATIYDAELKRYFSSRPGAVEMTDGRLFWKQVVGVADGSQRTFSLLAHQRGEYTMLYVRVQDQDNGLAYCTRELGRMIEGQSPQAEFDSANNLYILQLVGQRDYLLSKIGSNGEYLGGRKYGAPKARPYMRKLVDGSLQIVGGIRQDTEVRDPALPAPSKLSERPAGFTAN